MVFHWQARSNYDSTPFALKYIHFRDLRPDNILLGERGHILLTYFSCWCCVDEPINQYSVDNLYAAPGKQITAKYAGDVV